MIKRTDKILDDFRSRLRQLESELKTLPGGDTKEAVDGYAAAVSLGLLPPKREYGPDIDREVMGLADSLDKNYFGPVLRALAVERYGKAAVALREKFFALRHKTIEEIVKQHGYNNCRPIIPVLVDEVRKLETLGEKIK